MELIKLLARFGCNDAILCGRLCNRDQPQRIASISTEQKLPIKVSEVIVTIDEVNPEDILSVELKKHLYSDVAEETISVDRTTLTPGELSFKINDPQPDRNYVIQVTTYPISSVANTGILKISKVVYKEFVEQKEVKLAWSEESVSATLGDEAFMAPVLTCEPDDAEIKALIQYSSSDKNVATINAAGELTLVSPGKTTISATIDETEAFAGVSATYELTVEADPNTLLLVFNPSTLPAIDDDVETWKLQNGDGVWKISNFAVCENSNGITLGKNGSTASILTELPIDEHLDEIVLTISDFTEGKIDNITLYAYGNANQTHPIESVVVDQLTKGDIKFAVTRQPGLKYSIVVNGKSADAAGTLTISKIAYHKATDVDAAVAATLLVSENDSPDAVFKECKADAYKSNGNWIVLKFDTPEGHTVWHRFVKGQNIIEPVAKAPTFMTRAAAETDRQGFKQFSGDSFKHIDEGALEYYTENAAGTRSALSRVDFSGVTGVNEIERGNDSENDEFYNLQGIKIERPVSNGIYIVRRGDQTTKIFISRANGAL